MSVGTKALARAALGTALGVTILYLGALLPTARLALLCASSLGVVFVMLSCGNKMALCCYVATALLALLVLPQKGLGLAYAFLTGYYPVLKLRAERCPVVWKRWGIKLLAFNGLLVLLLCLLPGTVLSEMLGMDLSRWLLLPAANLVFLVYDFALTQVILIYIRRIAGRVK